MYTARHGDAPYIGGWGVGGVSTAGDTI